MKYFLVTIIFLVQAISLNALSLSETILSHNPVAYWRFNELSGNSALDTSGNGNTGTYNGGFSLNQAGATGDGDTAVNFNGSNGFMSANNITINNSFTALTWARSNTSTWNSHGWVTSARVPNGFIIHNNVGTTQVSGHIIANTSGTAHTGIGTFNVGDITDWHQYGVMYDANTQVASLILDGQIMVSINYAASNRDSSSNINVFYGQDMCCFPRFGNGQVDEAAIYDRALSLTEISAQFSTVSFEATTVPEPNALLLLLLAIAFIKERKFHKQGN